MDQGINIAGVQFRRAGKIYDFRYDELGLTVGDHVVVDTERGPSLARVVMLKFETESQNAERQLKTIMRRASTKEMDKKPKMSIEEIVSYTKDMIKNLKLDMNILTAEVQFGGNKITVFFTSPGRVDFRELVKELASGLKARVELKQVGARDETKLIGGTGICGREFCCSSFLREFVPVSIKMAKNQNLALNPNKVSGGCGRLLCCLTYEDDTYSALRKNIPPKGTRVLVMETGGYANVIKGDVLNQELLVENERGQMETYGLEEVEIVAKNAGKKSAAQDIEWGDDLDLEALEDFASGDNSGSKNKGRPPRKHENSDQKKGDGQGRRRNNRRRGKPKEGGDTRSSRNDSQRDGQKHSGNRPQRDGQKGDKQGGSNKRRGRNQNRNRKPKKDSKQ